MNYLKTGILSLLSVIVGIAAFAQKDMLPQEHNLNKPKLFQRIPDKINLSLNKLTPLLSMEKGHSIRLAFSDAFVFKGKVVSAVSKYNDGIRTAIVSSDDYPGANLIFSRIKNTDGTVFYRGRIISLQHGDCFELKEENGSYTLIKRNLTDMLND